MIYENFFLNVKDPSVHFKSHFTNQPSSFQGVGQWPYRAVAEALKVIPKTLMQNCGVNTIRTMTTLTAKHATGGTSWGVDGDTGDVVDMKTFGIWDTLQVGVFNSLFFSELGHGNQK